MRGLAVQVLRLRRLRGRGRGRRLHRRLPHPARRHRPRRRRLALAAGRPRPGRGRLRPGRRLADAGGPALGRLRRAAPRSADHPVGEHVQAAEPLGDAGGLPRRVPRPGPRGRRRLRLEGRRRAAADARARRARGAAPGGRRLRAARHQRRARVAGDARGRLLGAGARPARSEHRPDALAGRPHPAARRTPCRRPGHGDRRPRPRPPRRRRQDGRRRATRPGAASAAATSRRPRSLEPAQLLDARRRRPRDDDRVAERQGPHRARAPVLRRRGHPRARAATRGPRRRDLRTRATSVSSWPGSSAATTSSSTLPTPARRTSPLARSMPSTAAPRPSTPTTPRCPRSCSARCRRGRTCW